jgi:hypothetical protein
MTHTDKLFWEPIIKVSEAAFYEAQQKGATKLECWMAFGEAQSKAFMERATQNPEFIPDHPR